MKTPTPVTDERAGLDSASYIPRRAACAGSKAAEEGLPDLPAEETTTDGLDIHQSLETGDTEGLNETQAEIAERIKVYETDALEAWREDFGVGEFDTLREERFWIRDRITLDPVSSAKPDVVFVGATTALVINYKTGFKLHNDSERNWQVRTEVLAVWHQFPHLEVIRGALLSSRLKTSFDSTDFHLEDLKRAERELRHVLWRAQQPDAPRVPGPHCRYCKAQGEHCPESVTYSAVVMGNLPIKFKRGEKDLAVIEYVRKLTPQQLRRFHERKTVIASVLEQVDNQIRALPEDQLATAGMSVIPGINRHPIPNERTAEIKQKLSTVLTAEELERCIKIDRGCIEEIVAEKQGISKKDAKAWVIDFLKLEGVEGSKRIKLS